jgi:hypothetical protein
VTGEQEPQIYLDVNTNAAVEQAAATVRIADALEKMLSMIEGVQPSELAKKAKKHKKTRAKLRNGGKNNGKHDPRAN